MRKETPQAIESGSESKRESSENTKRESEKTASEGYRVQEKMASAWECVTDLYVTLHRTRE